MGEETDEKESPDAVWITPLIRGLEGFMRDDKDVTLNEILTLLHIAATPGISQTRAQTKIYIRRSGTNRIVQKLIEVDRLRQERDPADKRRDKLYLAGKGQRVIDRLRELFTAAARYRWVQFKEGGGHDPT